MKALINGKVLGVTIEKRNIQVTDDNGDRWSFPIKPYEWVLWLLMKLEL